MPDLESPSPVIERLAPIPSYLPAWQVHLLSGPPGGGKTTLLASWAKAFRDGLPIFGKHTNQLPWVGTILADREKTDTLQWYAAVGLADIPVYSIVDDPHLNEDHLEQRKRTPGMLEAIIDNFQIPDNGLLIIDPIVLWCGGDLNKYHIVYPAMIRLARLCLRRHITILGLCHTGKQKGDSKEQYTRAQDRILGSTALLGCSGTQMALEPPPKDSDDPYRFTWVPHHAKEETFELTRGTDGLFVLPEYGVQLPVLEAGREVARLVLIGDPAVAVTLEDRVVAVALADQLGSAFAMARPEALRRLAGDPPGE
jgi:hypothetical protein